MMITIWKTKSDDYKDGECKINGEEILGDLNIKLYYSKN
jgi:hypothetical protein